MAVSIESESPEADQSMTIAHEFIISESDTGIGRVVAAVTTLMDIGDSRKRDYEEATDPESRQENERAHALYEGSAAAASFILDCVLPRVVGERWQNVIAQARRQEVEADQPTKAERYIHTLMNISDRSKRDYKAAQTPANQSVRDIHAARVTAAACALDCVVPRVDGVGWEEALVAQRQLAESAATPDELST